jgi:hypothetical protein
MSTTKVDAVLAHLDRIKAAIDEAQRDLAIAPQPIMQWFGPPCPVWLALATAAYDRDRTRLGLLLERVPEPEEFTRQAHHKGGRKKAAADA